MQAESPESFLRSQNGAAGWQTVSALKSEVDRLVRSDLNAAARLADRIEQLASLISDPLARAFADASRARVLHHAGNHARANAMYEASATALGAGKLATEAALVRLQQVYALAQLGRYTEALRTAAAVRKALTGAEPAQLAQLETNVGNVYYLLDRYGKALDHYDRAREMLSSAGDETMRAVVDFSRSNILTELDRPDQALALLESARSAFESAGEPVAAAQCHFHIAYIEFHRGNYSAALAGYYVARDRLSSLGSAKLTAWCDLEIGEILLALNAFDEAGDSAAKARSRFVEIGMPYESARAAMNRALAAIGQRRLEDARAGLEEARDLFAENRNAVFTAVVDCYLSELAIKSEDWPEALARASKSLRVFARRKLVTRSAYAQLLLARASYRSGDLARSLRMARAALKRSEQVFAPSIAFQCHNLVGRVERERGRRGPALESFLRAVDTIESMRSGVVADELKASFLHDKMEAYEDAIAACLDDGGDESIKSAFRLVESSKSRALADLLARYVRGPGTRGGGAAGEAGARLAKLIEELNWYNSHAGDEEDKGGQRSAEAAGRYRRAAAACERRIAQVYRRMETEGADPASAGGSKQASVADLQAALGADETAVEFFTTGDQVSAFVATRQRLNVVRNIASKAEVERQLHTLRFQLEKFNFGPAYVDAYFGQLKRSTDDHLARLFRQLIAPLEGLIETERLIVIPHSVLHYVPFHSLRDGTTYLVERYEISYAPSASVLKLCRARRESLRANEPAVRLQAAEAGLGSGIVGRRFQSSRSAESRISKREGLVALGVREIGTPSIEDEIRALGSIFPDSVRLTGEEATRENLFKHGPAARFLHLASHGYFRRDNPMFSFLKLADSHLDFYSLLDLELAAEMVTLSACHTGINTVFPGDELHGLMRGFLYAGAPSVVASLWAVSDRSTADLMREMYSRICAGSSKRAALRQAQLSVKEAYGHPYYWAPFVLMGDPT